MDVQTVLAACGLKEAHYAAIGQAVPEAYAALHKLAQTTPMLGNFAQGGRGLSYLRDIAVQHALAAKAAETKLFYTATDWNSARNHCFLKLQAEQVVLTTHYSGAKGSRGVRRAVARAELVMRTPDLFGADADLPDADIEVKSAYAQLVHAGLEKPRFAVLQIPNRNQQSFRLAPMTIDLTPPIKGAVEEVQDRINDVFKARVRDLYFGSEQDVG